MTTDENIDTTAALAERFSSLPKVVQDAITSADVQSHLRDLANTHKLHVDQWQVLENNVMLTLLGFQPTSELAQNLQKDLEITQELAAELAKAVSEIVFAPIRGEMEQMLSHPTAEKAETSAIEDMRTEALAHAASEAAAIAAPVVPATPPPPPPAEKAVRGSIAGSYTSTPSHERKAIEGDPYREQLA